MISVNQEISSLLVREDELHTSLDKLRGQRNKVKEHKQLDKELAQLIRKRQNLESLARFEIGMPVHRADSRALGKVTEIIITPGGLREIWVSWDGKLQVPEQPHLLEPDAYAIAQIIQVGDRIIIGKSHAARGKIFTVARLLARGWVESTDENVFPREYWEKVESPIESADDEHKGVAKENTAPVIEPGNEMVEESPQEELELLPESVVTVEILGTDQGSSELSQQEEKERHRLELKVERAFYEAAIALKELYDRRLYRSTHSRFDHYCRDRFGFSQQNADLLIRAAKVISNLKVTTNGCNFLPTSERQVRPLTKLQPDEQRQIWQQAVEAAGNKVPSGRIVKDIVQRLKEKPLTLASDFCSVGDAFTLVKLEEGDRKYNGCWAIAVDLREFTVVVDVHDTTLTVKPDNLQPIDSPDVRRQLPETLKRIRRLRSIGSLDRGAGNVLKDLGQQIYLTEFEAELLTFIEQRYGIIDQS